MTKIAILQLTQNLDDAVHGFKNALLEHGVTANYLYRNADGRSNLLPDLAQELLLESPDLLFACSTPAALASINLPANLPVVFTPVFDPVAAGVVASLTLPGGKATGVAGMIPAEKKITFIHELLPTAQTIGILCHTTDSSCILETKNMVNAAAGCFHITEIPIHQPAQLSLLPTLLPTNLDALFLPIGKLLEDNFATIAYYADGMALPIIASHGPNVPLGALGGLVANHYRLGAACALQALQILDGADPGLLAVGMADEPDTLLNQFAADTLGIVIPDQLLASATEIFS